MRQNVKKGTVHYVYDTDPKGFRYGHNNLVRTFSVKNSDCKNPSEAKNLFSGWKQILVAKFTPFDQCASLEKLFHNCADVPSCKEVDLDA